MKKPLFTNFIPTEPSRKLSVDFSDRVMENIEVSGHGRLSKSMKGLLFMKIRKLKTASITSIAIAASLLAAGGVYASTQWHAPATSVDVSSIKTIASGKKSGDIRVWINLDSCPGQHVTHPERDYYEIRQGSTLTPDQLANGLRADCETDMLAQLFPVVLQSPLHTAQGTLDQYYAVPVKVMQIDASNIRVNATIGQEKISDATLPIDSDASFYYKGDKVQLSQIQPGDWVTLVAHTTALGTSIWTDSPGTTISGFPVGATVKGAIKHLYSPQDSAYKTMGRDWTRLVPDSTSPDGWRELVPLTK